jgi:hypothetical protein
MQAKPLGFLAEEARNQGFYHVGLDLFGKALANDRRRDMPAPEARDAGHLLVFLDQRIGLAVDIRDWNLNFDLTFGGAFFARIFFGFGGAHNSLSQAPAAAESEELCSAATPCSATLSVKTPEEQRQTEEGDAGLTKVINVTSGGQLSRTGGVTMPIPRVV